MKYNIIGDIHGRTKWKDLVLPDAINIFVGDYFSPYREQAFYYQRENFLDIIQYKIDHPDNVILLLGNHDEDHWHIQEHYSRFDYENVEEIKSLFEQYKELFQVAYSIENKVLVTHAGVSVVWYTRYILGSKLFDIRSLPRFDENNYDKLRSDLIYESDDCYVVFDGNKIVDLDFTPDEVASNINNLWISGKYSAFNFRDNCDRFDYCGESIYQSPMWIRIRSLLASNIFKFSNYKQVFGHTINSDIVCDSDEYKLLVADENSVNDCSLIMVDCLEYKTSSVIYDSELGKFSINIKE